MNVRVLTSGVAILSFALTSFIPGMCAPNKRNRTPRMSYIDNGAIRLGIDLNIGGAVTYLAAKGKPNLINSHDWGRQIQMSFYSGPNPYEPNGKKPHKNWKQLGWNPIQSGDVGGFRSKVTEHKNDGSKLYVKCIPMHWPLSNQPAQCTFECWFELEGTAVLVRCRLTNHRDDKTLYKARHQELPAVYTNGPWYKLMSYDGDKPFTNGPLTRIVKKNKKAKFPWTGWQSTERWAALVNDQNEGLGIWTPKTTNYLGGFAGRAGRGGPKDSPTGYIAPLSTEHLDYNIVYDYGYTLIVGSLKQIRSYVYKHADKTPKPDFVFRNDRQGWYYNKAHDTGFPVRNQLDITIDKPAGRLLCNKNFWTAKDTPTLYISAAHKSSAKSARLFFATRTDPKFNHEKSVGFPIKTDGKFHTYTLELSQCPAYKGAITQFMLEPASGGKAGDNIKIRYISGQQRD